MIDHHIRYVIANDLSPAAVEAMKRNIAINDLDTDSESDPTGQKVQVNEGDAWYDFLWSKMYLMRPFALVR